MIYKEQTPSYEVEGEFDKITDLRREVYGLKQSLWIWFTTFTKLIHKQGFFACEVEPTILEKTNSARCIIVSIYDNDILVVGNDLYGINQVKEFLH